MKNDVAQSDTHDGHVDNEVEYYVESSLDSGMVAFVVVGISSRHDY